MRQSIELISKFPTIIAYAYNIYRHSTQGRSLHIRHPHENLSIAENFLHMLKRDFTDLASVSFSRQSSDNQFLFSTSFETFRMVTDVQRMQQVIINLLSNADKFTKRGKITLDFSVNEEKQMAIFSVTDTGCGIPKEKQGLVFERFEKLNEYAQGTGLGLSICKLIVHKWRGSIWIDPDYTGGARFVFSHPLNIEKE